MVVVTQTPRKYRTVIQMIVESPPPMPKCWHSPREWQDYLMSLHASGERITRRVDIGKYAGKRETRNAFVDIPYCADCTERKRKQMEAAERCYPTTARLNEETQ